MKKNKVWKIVKYNIERNLRNKWFIGLNAVLFIVAIFAINFNGVKTILKNKNIISKDKEIKFEVYDDTDSFYNILEDKINQNKDIDNVSLSRIEEVSYDENMDKSVVIIDAEKSDENILNIKVISKDGMKQKYYGIIEASVEETKEELIKSKFNITSTQIEKIKENIKIERIMVGVDNSNSDTKQIVQTAVSYITLIILMLILSKIAGDISQEKVTKSIEYVLTSITAEEYLIAKVISISLTMILQVVFTFIYFIISSSISSFLNITFAENMLENSIQGFSLSKIGELIDSTMIMYIIVALVFLVLTVFFMCIVQAALTAKTTSMSEASNTTTLLVTLNFGLYFASCLAISPLVETHAIIYILSCLPIFSMYFIPSMIIIGQAKIIQIIIATVLLVISIPISIKICSKVFKDGVLNNNIKKKKEKDEYKDIKEKELAKVNKRELAKYGYVIGMSVILYITVQVILTYVLAIFIPTISNALNIGTEIVEMVVNIIIFAVSLYIPTLFVKSYTEEDYKRKEKLNIKDVASKILISVPIVFIVQIVVGILLEKLGFNYDILDKMSIYKSTGKLYDILFFIYIAIMPAIFEELFIRKAILNYSKKYGTTFAIISSALLFSIMHLNISQSLFAFIMGIILAIVALRFNSIIPTGIIHFLNNGYAALTLIFAENNTALTIINIIFYLMLGIGIILLIMTLIKNKNNIKEKIENLKNKKEHKKQKYRYIAFDYTFIVACILMLVMLIVTQKMLSIL